jgi:hypothetical protein
VHPAHRFRRLLHAAEGDQSLAAGLFGRHASADVLLNFSFEMKGKFVLQVSIVPFP